MVTNEGKQLVGKRQYFSSRQTRTSVAMSEASTQTEALDTHRNLYTQRGENKQLMITVLVETKILKEIETRPRILINLKKKAPRKPGMSVSEVNTEKRHKPVLKKCVGTESVKKQNEEPEIIILKEVRVNHISVAAVTEKAEEGRSEKESRERKKRKIKKRDE